MTYRSILKAVRPLKRELTRLPQMMKNLLWEPYLQQLTDSSVVVMWATHTPGQPTVEYQRRSGNRHIMQGSSQMLDYRVRQWSGHGVYLHRVALAKLRSNTPYAYKICLDGRDMLPQRSLSFQTGPMVGSNVPFTFIAMGDFGNGSPSQRQLSNQLRRDAFQFILTVGDNSQGEGTYLQYDETVFQVYQDIFCKAGLFTAMGNHDYPTDNGTPYLSLFDPPRNALQDQDIGRYYSFDYGNVHFVVVDSNIPLDVDDAIADDDMFDWLRMDLSQTAQPWKIVSCHHPPYNTGDHGSDERVRTKLIPIFEEFGVDLVLSGHQHNYQRSKPLRGGQVTTSDEGGIVYIISGAGSTARHAVGDADWLAASVGSVKHGLYNRITASGDHLRIEAIDHQGETHDACTLVKRVSVRQN